MRYVEVPICKSLHYLLQHCRRQFTVTSLRLRTYAYQLRSVRSSLGSRSFRVPARILPAPASCLAWQVEFRKAFRKAALQI